MKKQITHEHNHSTVFAIFVVFRVSKYFLGDFKISTKTKKANCKRSSHCL